MFNNNKIILFALSFFIILTLITGGFYILHENKRDYYLDCLLYTSDAADE